jgi:DNA-directed RNA polymerase alpha subunit
MTDDRVNLSLTRLSIRTSNLLRKNNIFYLDQLLELSSREMIKWEGFGRRALNEIRTFLAENSLSLTDETVNPDGKYHWSVWDSWTQEVTKDSIKNLLKFVKECEN